MGKWSSWQSDGCSPFCRLLQSRRCLVSPCHGEKTKSDLPCSNGECEQPMWSDWSQWSCQCDATRTRHRDCDGGQFKLVCQGLAIHTQKLDVDNIETCDMNKMDECNEDELENYLNFGKELEAMYKNWSSQIDTDIVALLTMSYDKWIEHVQSRKKWDRIYQIWSERYHHYSQEAGMIMSVGFGLIILVGLGQVYHWVKMRRLLGAVTIGEYRYSDLESESE